jgi:murein DD-endopeptidase MepM/ murein hydrolase activator NlpD
VGRDTRLFLIAIVAISAFACTSAVSPRVERSSEASNVLFPNDPARPVSATGGDPLRCTDRVAIPTIEHVFEASWSPDSSAIAVSRIVTIPSRITITGYEEDQRLSVFDLRTGRLRDIDQGKEPQWSASGAYLSYWKDDGYLHIVLGNTVAAIIDASSPNVRWVGDELYYWYADEIRRWRDGTVTTVVHVDPDLVPRYPRDDVYFSGDGTRFAMTRYYTNGTTDRWIGVTATGAMSPLEDSEASFTEWSPKGATLLLRTAYGATLRGRDGDRKTSSIFGLGGMVHGWTADGRVFFGTMSPTVPAGNAFDRYKVWDGSQEPVIATLPNLLGARAFSPDGRFFTGVSRTGLYTTQLELYRCGSAAESVRDPRADPVARAHIASIDADERRFVRPVAGAITQFVQGRHTGIDVAAPVGSILVAADDGVVDAVEWVPVGGRRVCVMHAANLESCDYHTSLPLVSVGDRVVRGQPVALVGLTGLTGGPHVHWEAKLNGMIVNPLAR